MGGRGFSPGSFDAPSAVAIDRNAGFLLVVDTGNHRVQKFDLNGKMLLSFGRLGSGDGEFNKPSDVAIDKRGNIFVSDTGNNRVQKFDSSGKFLAEWGKFSRRRRGVEIENPSSVAYSDEGLGAIYVLVSPDCRVLKYDIDGALVKEWAMHKKGEAMPCGPSRIRIEPRQYTVYIADTENNRVALYDKDGEPLGELKGGKVAFRKPAGICINDVFGEQLVVADTGNNLVQIFRRGR
jgi:tripartite motif-containing protein 71